MKYIMLLIILSICHLSFADDLNTFVEKSLQITVVNDSVIALASYKNISD